MNALPERAPVPRAEDSPEPPSYEAASARVEEIIKRLDSGDASLQETLELVSEGKALIELCAPGYEGSGAVGDRISETFRVS